MENVLIDEGNGLFRIKRFLSERDLKIFIGKLEDSGKRVDLVNVGVSDFPKKVLMRVAESRSERIINLCSECEGR